MPTSPESRGARRFRVVGPDGREVGVYAGEDALREWKTNVIRNSPTVESFRIDVLDPSFLVGGAVPTAGGAVVATVAWTKTGTLADAGNV